MKKHALTKIFIFFFVYNFEFFDHFEIKLFLKNKQSFFDFSNILLFVAVAPWEFYSILGAW